MPRLSNGKITTSAIFYNRGVPPNAKNFGTYVAVNYEMVRQVARFLHLCTFKTPTFKYANYL